MASLDIFILSLQIIIHKIALPITLSSEKILHTCFRGSYTDKIVSVVIQSSLWCFCRIESFYLLRIHNRNLRKKLTQKKKNCSLETKHIFDCSILMFSSGYFHFHARRVSVVTSNAWTVIAAWDRGLYWWTCLRDNQWPDLSIETWSVRKILKFYHSFHVYWYSYHRMCFLSFFIQDM